jgi:hypothetical protein
MVTALRLVRDDGDPGPKLAPKGLHPTYKTPLGDLAVEWVRGRKARNDISGRSVVTQQSGLTAFLEAFGDRPVATLNRHDILAWQEAIGHLGPASRRGYQNTVRLFCRWLVLEDYLDRDPTVGMSKVRERRRVPKTPSVEEVRKVLDACPSKRSRAMVWLMVGCGLRCAEVANLDVRDYDPVARTILVRESSTTSGFCRSPRSFRRTLTPTCAPSELHRGRCSVPTRGVERRRWSAPIGPHRNCLRSVSRRGASRSSSSGSWCPLASTWPVMAVVPIRCAARRLPTLWRRVMTSRSYSRCWATPAWRPPRCTCGWPTSTGCGTPWKAVHTRLRLRSTIPRSSADESRWPQTTAKERRTLGLARS